MQRYCTELTEKLLKSLDKEYNVVDMGAVVDVITALEKTTITKEVLEITRLGKHINELRRKTTNDVLAKRAKDLVRRWRGMVLPSSNTVSTHSVPTDNMPLYNSLNGSTKPQSPTARGLAQNPIVTRVIKPQSPLLHAVLPNKVVSPNLCVNSERSQSPNITPIKPTAVSNYKLNSASSPRLIDSTNQNHTVEAVPRTHSSNKRLRKEDNQQQQQQHYPDSHNISHIQYHQDQQQQCNVNLSSSRDDLSTSVNKKQRVNGENSVISNPNSQVPSPSSSLTRERNQLDVSSSREIDAIGPKKRGRKKGSKSFKNQLIPEDRVKEKLASISRNPKLKTTQELLADLQARGSTTTTTATTISGNTTTTLTTTTTTVDANIDTHSLKRMKNEPPTTAEILRNTNIRDNDNSRSNSAVINHKNKLSSTSSDCQSRVNADISEDTEADNNIVPSSTNLTVKEILAKLPPLDLESIRWSDDEIDQHHNDNDDNNTDHTLSSSQKQITDADVDRLHQMSIESVNGNFQVKLTNNVDNEDESKTDLTGFEAIGKTLGVNKRQVQDGTDREFREWHEMLAKPSYDGQILHILPYVIID